MASTWIDRSGHDRTPVIPCHELSGVVSSLGFGATGVSIGDEVYGLTDWYRDGAAAELITVEARNLALRPRSVDHPASSTLPLAGLTAWQALFRHGALKDGDTLVVLGAGGGVGSLAVQLAHLAGARVLGIGRSKDRTATLEPGASAFADPDHEPFPNLTETSLVLDTARSLRAPPPHLAAQAALSQSLTRQQRSSSDHAVRSSWSSLTATASPKSRGGSIKGY